MTSRPFTLLYLKGPRQQAVDSDGPSWSANLTTGGCVEETYLSPISSGLARMPIRARTFGEGCRQPNRLR